MNNDFYLNWVSSSRTTNFTPDENYKLIPPLPKDGGSKRGIQCGECGVKFDYGMGYGYCCMNNNCPLKIGR